MEQPPKNRGAHQSSIYHESHASHRTEEVSNASNNEHMTSGRQQQSSECHHDYTPLSPVLHKTGAWIKNTSHVLAAHQSNIVIPLSLFLSLLCSRTNRYFIVLTHRWRCCIVENDASMPSRVCIHEQMICNCWYDIRSTTCEFVCCLAWIQPL